MVLTPVLGAIFLRDRIPVLAWAAAGVSVIGLYLLSGAGGDFDLRGDGLVLLCAISLAAHILATARAVEQVRRGRACWRSSSGWCGVVLPRHRRRPPGSSRRPRAPPSGPR